MRLGERTHLKFRDERNQDELSVTFKEWALSRHDEMKWDMIDTVRKKKDVWMFSRLVELFTAAPEERGGLNLKEVELRYVVNIDSVVKNNKEQQYGGE